MDAAQAIRIAAVLCLVACVLLQGRR